jgi:DNA-directed RNA polymerase subunit RPC12/RpoP
MFCINCGSKFADQDNFCTNCGHIRFDKVESSLVQEEKVVSEEKWWQRILKVIYILLYIPLIIILPAVWYENKSAYSGYYNGIYQYEDSYERAFGYSLLTLIIYLVIVRLLKITALYITVGNKPEWKKEFKRFF